MNPFEALSETLDLTVCEREPIHVPAAIQPHGAVLAARAYGLFVTHASLNLAAVLGLSPETVLGRPLRDALGEAACKSLFAAQQGVNLGQVHTMPGPDGTTLHLQAHRSGHRICIDIEPLLPEPWQQPSVTMVQAVVETFGQAASQLELCERAVRGLKQITGYDRVMAYRFGEGGHGEVIAEACEAGLQPFLGQQYPASDVPPQARRQYLRQRVGVIADSSYRPAPLLTDEQPDATIPLDLTHSALRSVSPVHREYMRNMKTAASLTIGLADTHNGEAQLWGMLVCHHATARTASPALRAIAGTVGQVVSLLLHSMGTAEVSAQRLARDQTLHGLIERLAAPGPLIETFAAMPTELLHLVEATGAVVRLGGNTVAIGQTPEPAAVERVLELLHPGPGGGISAVEDLGLRHPALAAACTGVASGAMLMPLDQANGGQANGGQANGGQARDAIVWFRPEQVRTVVWGGNPAAHGTADPVTGQLSPRASFAAWKAITSGHATPWADADVALANDLRRAVGQEIARRDKVALLLFEAVVETSPVALVLAGASGRIRMLNRSVELMFGYDRQELLDQPLEVLMPERFRARHVELRRQFMSGELTRAMGQGIQVAGRRRDGTEFPIEVGLDRIDAASAPVEPSSGGSTASATPGIEKMVQASITDLTARHAAESDRQQREAEKEQERRELERSNADLEQFAYAVSHDLSSPLRAIGHLGEWIADDIAATASEATLDNITLLRSRVVRMQKLLEGLLRYCTIGRFENATEDVLVPDLIADVLVLLGPPPGFRVTCECDPAPVRTERIALQMVLENLIDNVFKHRDREDGHVTIAMRRAGGMAEFRVTDDGPGIAAEFQQRIFAMFQTLKSRDIVEGSGLGLAIAKRHVAMHGGTIWIESAPPARGCSFVFTWKPTLA